MHCNEITSGGKREKGAFILLVRETQDKSKVQEVFDLQLKGKL
jgi:hypothetical protein